MITNKLNGMRHLLKIILLLLPGLSVAQNKFFNQPNKKQADSLQFVLQHTNNDTLKMSICDELGAYYIEKNNSIALYYFNEELLLARKLKQKLREAGALDGLSSIAFTLGNYSESLKFADSGIEIARNDKCEKNVWRVTQFDKDGDPHKSRLYVLANLYEKLADLYQKSGNNTKCVSSYFAAEKIAESTDDKIGLSFYTGNLGAHYLNTNKLDSALFFSNKSLAYSNASGFKVYQGGTLATIGRIYLRKGNYISAKKYLIASIKVNKEQNNQRFLPYSYIALADLYRSTGKSDSGVYYARLALRDSKLQHGGPNMSDAYMSLFAAYKSEGKMDSAFLYLQRSKTLGDSLNGAEKIKVSQYINVGFDEQLRVQELEKQQIQVQTKTRTYVMLTGILIFVIIATILYGNNKQKQKANKVLESTLSNLKSTQTQLIQSEKMASLGELTAGIAHEIQNPLNFVNNFSEVNQEILEELKEESQKPKAERDEQLEADLINGLLENERKINHHGKRADSIVKGMLEHSRSGSGQKESTDINQLADEYLRLSYHGLRAKDKSFNAELVADFDPALPKIKASPQDIGRVLLNLFNNAFYAVNQKQKTAGADYKPEVSVSTSVENGHVVIKVKDNGVGMTEHVKEKIMQPFFTTKPTGEGTGLGLSLTYDMVVKGHGGSIEVNTKEGEYSEFIIKLPVQ
jgi:two-component system NtrC family sensor kinase